jgi:hypothetical protein
MEARTKSAKQFLGEISTGLEALADTRGDLESLPERSTATPQEVAFAKSAAEKVNLDAELSPDEQFALEAIIIPDKRPAFDIVNDDYKRITHPDWTRWESNAGIRQRLRQLPGHLLLEGTPGLLPTDDPGLGRARYGSIGVWIEDKNSGTILLQQALRRQWPANAIESELTAMGKDERAILVSGYVYRENVKYTERAYNKTVIYKGKARNHLIEQVENSWVGDKDNKREDDFLDTFCYGIAISLGNENGF